MITSQTLQIYLSGWISNRREHPYALLTPKGRALEVGSLEGAGQGRHFRMAEYGSRHTLAQSGVLWKIIQTSYLYNI